ncbi:MAG: histidine phosphatase family protein [Anaerolineae bacterium]|nr:histidine phosphatase family protein [Anaerolineae bacterium]
MLKIILVRHGQTEWSARGTHGGHFCGRIDIKLNATGIVQAQSIAEALKPLDIAAVYTSPLNRSLNTAIVIAQTHSLKAKPLAALLDINYGQWSGRSAKEVIAQWPDLHRQWIVSPQEVQMPGGESLADVRRRIEETLDWLWEQHDGEIVVIVGHEAINKVMLCYVIGLDNGGYWRLRQDTGCINRIDYDRVSFCLLTMNEVCHLLAQPSDLNELA